MSGTDHQGSGISGSAILALVALLTVILLLQTVYQTLRLREDSAALQVRYAAQEPVLADVDRVRAQLESLAGQTAILAGRGNANALQLQEQLRARGITIRPPQ